MKTFGRIVIALLVVSFAQISLAVTQEEADAQRAIAGTYRQACVEDNTTWEATYDDYRDRVFAVWSAVGDAPLEARTSTEGLDLSTDYFMYRDNLIDDYSINTVADSRDFENAETHFATAENPFSTPQEQYDAAVSAATLYCEYHSDMGVDIANMEANLSDIEDYEAEYGIFCMIYGL